ncbi:MAG: ribonuclease III [Candidatus Blackburnbacteria bacterium RIFCSPHIGHO2_02_FULL_39_13]|uniref:Ribonuclease 3 n=1 Tax=Candidatus Blackburnbacteria bacterium RIFCSPLOWO2_01_FULL_40_20 TaxID=1797519 RepID=A0A1G1VF31_9BACT|nr:MAG: Ribonuclease 3 [Microgenomates group bacterium GW2011_GWA2_39_19]OGY07224.1 MAG: ribonuclease III [Candidatus Blackburnbacteria bacterium RIFCSPHIGHO2_01_FULL_40_17]OGY09447.1 MAG: ribonuclease III [Candidatus Blackburnbacteria bacterium RIFCSPHIGHO2_02_FULL_39_13]OGY14025.1 MAG: ribonuclease III [Candidatus Blackburnbacteria bacterium RIFCSPLOWO2_01_FULL_40_20]OGY15717.1 MAG: ribonuclease III [Candidatus Blackburnbacteria bacterium RIFCSPLOWO2_02_FULL_40_10]HBL51610.1 ribonuclease III
MLKQKDKEKSVENKLNVVFKDKGVLHRALLHRSFLNENPEELESNERLEFLGDAILEFIVSEHLYERFPSEDEGHLTALRSKLVNTTSLATVATELGLGESLYLSRGEEKSGGRQNTGLLANTTEAIIGAIYLDQGLESTKKFVFDYITRKVPQVVQKSLKDAKSLLQEYVQASGFAAPVYRTVSETGPDHAKNFLVEVIVGKNPFAQGSGLSKQVAAQNAAEEALAKWKKEPH